MEHTVAALFLALAVIIAASRIAGALARAFHQPRVLGELIIGVILGPTVLDFLHWEVLHGVELAETIKELAELGVLLLMFLVGLEVNLAELAKVRNVAVFGGVMGALLPVAAAWPILTLYDYGWEQALFAGVVLAATSVSISAQVLLELGHLQTKEGNGLLAMALIDDILAILLVSLTVAVVGGEAGASGGAGELVMIVMRMGLYLGIALAVAWFVVPPLLAYIQAQPALSQSFGMGAFGLILALLFGWTAEEFGGVATITGAFIAGVGISQASPSIRHDIEVSVGHIAYVFLVPVFFVDVGLETDLSSFPLGALPFAMLLLMAAVVSKVVGCGIGARAGGFTPQESLRVGTCMISRGEVGLIVATIGLSAGVFEAESALFASLFLVILLTTVVTPILVRHVFPKDTPHPTHDSQAHKGAQAT